MKRIISIALSICFAFTLHAKLAVESIFTDNMVVKQNSKVLFWGTCSPKQDVAITTTWSDEVFHTTSNKKGEWCVQVTTSTADLKSHTITISNDKSLYTIENVLLGEVWLCSGQSNMGMKMKGFFNLPVIGSKEAIANSTTDLIRYFVVHHQPQSTPADCLRESEWQLCNPNTVPDYSATAYFFARQLTRTLGVPVGLIDASSGGSKIQAWMSKESLAQFDSIVYPTGEIPRKEVATTPTGLFNGSIYPLIRYAISGCIWYQGCRNRHEHAIYPDLIKAMVTDWRKLWKVGNFPFYATQITPYEFHDHPNSALIRIAQEKAMYEIPNSGIAILSDVGNRPNVHAPKKQEVGERLAYLALNKTYGFTGIACESPRYNKMEVKGSVAIITFANAHGGLTSYNKEITALEIAGEDQVFHPAVGKITKRGLEVTSQFVNKPIAVRYGFKSWFDGTLYNVSGLPASSFRTDNW